MSRMQLGHVPQPGHVMYALRSRHAYCLVPSLTQTVTSRMLLRHVTLAPRLLQLPSSHVTRDAGSRSRSRSRHTRCAWSRHTRCSVTSRMLQLGHVTYAPTHLGVVNGIVKKDR
eukprot:3510163-Rhodomonas_salina.1